MLAEYRVLMLTLISLGLVLVLKGRSWLLTTLVQCGIFSFSQEKLTRYNINNLYSGTSKDDKALTVRLPQLHKYLCMCLASERKPLAGTQRLGVSTQAQAMSHLQRHLHYKSCFTCASKMTFCLNCVHILLLIPSYKARFEHFSEL